MAKYDIIKTSKLKFARFGGLSSVKQEGYDNTNENFHGPPAKRGFYSFVWPLCEHFLLSGGWTCWPWVVGSKFKYVRDEHGNIITDLHPDFSKRGEHRKYFSVPTKNWNKNQAAIKETLFDGSDDAEHDAQYEAAKKDWEDNHKDEPRWVLAEKPSPKIFTYDGELWHHLGRNLKQHQILSRKSSWVKSSIEDYREALEREMHSSRKDMQRDPWRGALLPNKSPFFCSSKDHLEVFIEKL